MDFSIQGNIFTVMDIKNHKLAVGGVKSLNIFPEQQTKVRDRYNLGFTLVSNQFLVHKRKSKSFHRC